MTACVIRSLLSLILATSALHRAAAVRDQSHMQHVAAVRQLLTVQEPEAVQNVNNSQLSDLLDQVALQSTATQRAIQQFASSLLIPGGRIGNTFADIVAGDGVADLLNMTGLCLNHTLAVISGLTQQKSWAVQSEWGLLSEGGECSF